MPESHALRTLTRPNSAGNIADLVHLIPVEKMEELIAKVDELKKT